LMALHSRLSLAALVLVRYAVWIAPLAWAQPAGFEGVVAFKMMGKGEGGEMTQMYKGTKNRTEVSAGGQSSVMIMDMTTGVMTVLMPPQKAYMIMDFRKMGGALSGLPFGRGRKEARGSAGAPPTMPR